MSSLPPFPPCFAGTAFVFELQLHSLAVVSVLMILSNDEDLTSRSP